MAADVFFIPFGASGKNGLAKGIKAILERAGLQKIVLDGEMVAVKTHLGEKGNTAFVKPIFVAMVVRAIKETGGKPFLTDTNTLYVGSRGNAISHLETAYIHGFLPYPVGAPVIIADGLRGSDGVEIEIDGKHFKVVEIAKHISEADSMVVITHFKGHDLTAFGGAIKNIGMGCSTRKGKLNMHSNVKPFVEEDKCTGCKLCTKWCPVDAIKIVNKKAIIDSDTCIGCAECIGACPEKAINIIWDAASNSAQEKMAEFASGVSKVLNNKFLFINFLTEITPACDCYPFSGAPIVPDIGILASRDPVAIDMASYDLVNNQPGLNREVLGDAVAVGADKFKAIYPHLDGLIQLRHAKALGLGSIEYNLIKMED